MSTEKVDDLHCGNCGYDGGLQHAVEKLAWEKALHAQNLKAQVANDTRVVRAIAGAIAACFCALVFSISGYYAHSNWVSAAHPVQANPVVEGYRTANEMYQKCLSVASNNDPARNACTDAFSKPIGQLTDQMRATGSQIK